MLMISLDWSIGFIIVICLANSPALPNATYCLRSRNFSLYPDNLVQYRRYENVK